MVRIGGMPLLYQPGDILMALCSRDLVAEELPRTQALLVRHRHPSWPPVALTCLADLHQLERLELLQRRGPIWTGSAMAYGFAYQTLGDRA